MPIKRSATLSLHWSKHVKVEKKVTAIDDKELRQSRDAETFSVYFKYEQPAKHLLFMKTFFPLQNFNMFLKGAYSFLNLWRGKFFQLFISHKTSDLSHS